MLREIALPEASYLCGIAAELRSRAQSVAPARLREQLLALAEYYDGMAATGAQPALAPSSP